MASKTDPYFEQMRLAVLEAKITFQNMMDGQSPAKQRDALMAMQTTINEQLSALIYFVGGDADPIYTDNGVDDIRYAFENAIEAWEDQGPKIDVHRQYSTLNHVQQGIGR